LISADSRQNVIRARLTNANENAVVGVRFDGHEIRADDGQIVIIDRENKGCVNGRVDQSQKISHSLKDLSKKPPNSRRALR
jgi:hypothetical protein